MSLSFVVVFAVIVLGGGGGGVVCRHIVNVVVIVAVVVVVAAATAVVFFRHRSLSECLSVCEAQCETLALLPSNVLFLVELCNVSE